MGPIALAGIGFIGYNRYRSLWHGSHRLKRGDEEGVLLVAEALPSGDPKHVRTRSYHENKYANVEAGESAGI
jgi:hypothetical protein